MVPSQTQILTILYDLMRVIGSEASVHALLVKVLQRLLFHTGLPVGVVLETVGGDGALRVGEAVGSVRLLRLRGTTVTLDVTCGDDAITTLRGDALVRVEPRLFEGWGFGLRLPVRGYGCLVLVGAEGFESPIPFEQIFVPVADSLARAVQLCRVNEAYTRELATDRDAARASLAESLRALQRSQEVLERAQAAAKVGHWSYAYATQTRTYSANLRRIYGLAADAPTLGTELDSRLHPDDAERVAAAARGTEVGAPWNIEHRIVVDGQVRWVHSLTEITRGADGSPESLLGIVQDITDRKEAELRERNAQAMVAAIYQQSAYAIVLIDATTLGFVEVNGATCDLLGYDRAELLRCTLVDIQFDRGIDEVRAAVQGVLGEDSRHFDVCLRRKDGVTVPVRVAPRHVRLNDREHIVAIWIDLTAQLAAEAQLRKLALAVEQSPESIFITNLAAEFEYVNEAFLRTTGYRRDEVLGRNTLILKSSQTPGETYADLWARVGRGETWRGELFNRRKDGTEHPEAVTVVPVRQPDGQITNYLAIKEDVTDKRRMAAEIEAHRAHLEEVVVRRTLELERTTRALAEQSFRLQAVNDELQGIFDAATVGIALARGRNIIRCNRRLEEIFGYGPGELDDQPARVWYPDEATFVRAGTIIVTTLARGETAEEVIELIRKDGSRFWGRITARALTAVSLDGAQIAMVEDVTEQRASAEKLRVAKELAESASRAKSEFLANMSHEIRTPMNAIIGLTHGLKGDIVDARQRAQLGKINDAARLLLNLINDILDLSKIEAGKMRLEKADFDIGRLVTNVGNLVLDKARAKGLEFVIDVGAVPRMLLGDGLRLQQILLNFMGNAVKFTESGSVSLRATVVSATDDASVLRFEVTDTGIGLTDEQQARLFAPFEQADASTTRRHGGTGLGLAISRRLSVLMGGRIGVRSELGRGSSFWVELPFDGAAARASGASPSEPPRSMAIADGTFDAAAWLRARGGYVLVVEDNGINQEVATAMLESVGLRVDVAEDGQAAVAQVHRVAYDVILMDMQMPVMDGIAATRAIRQLPAYVTTPIVAMTANAFDEDRQRCLAAGMNDHIAKPVDPDTLFAVLARWLSAPASVAPRSLAPPPPPPPSKPPTDASLRRRIEAIPGLDVEGGLRVACDSLEFYADLLHRCVAPRYLEAVRSAAAASDPTTARRGAHTLKGVAASVGATRVRDAAAAIEALLRDAPPEVAGSGAYADALDTLDGEFSALRDAVFAVLGPAPDVY